MLLCAPWTSYKNKQLFTNMKIKQTNLRYNTKHIQGINPMDLGVHCYPFSQNLHTQLKTLNPINVLMATGAITKTVTLAMIFHNTSGGGNMCVRFGYGPLTIYNHIQRHISGSMNAYPINMICTIQQSITEGFNK